MSGITLIIWDFGIYLLIGFIGGMEQNPEPIDTKYLSLCHWTLNSVAAHDFAKVNTPKAFNATKKFDFIRLSQSYLDATISSDSIGLSLGYNMIHPDHPKNIKQGGVCFYYRETLPVKTTQINYLPECLACEVSYGNKKSLLLHDIGLLAKLMMNLMSFFVVLNT